MAKDNPEVATAQYKASTLDASRTVTERFLEAQTPSKNLVQGKLRTHMWRRRLATPFRKLINSESPSCA